VADNTDPLLKEIDEELRHERMAELWRRYGNYLIGAALLVVVAVAGHQGWKSYDASRRQEASRQYAEAARIAAAQDAEKAFAQMTQTAPKGYALIARFREANLAAQQGDGARAATLYRKLATDGGVESPYRDLALLLAVLNDADRAEPRALRQEIGRLTTDASPWRYVARELAALLLLRAGEDKNAGEEFRRLADDAGTPAGVKTRARDMAAAIGKRQG